MGTIARGYGNFDGPMQPGRGRPAPAYKSERSSAGMGHWMDGVSTSPAAPRVLCPCGGSSKASVLRRRPDVPCHGCGRCFSLVGIDVRVPQPRVSQSVNLTGLTARPASAPVAPAEAIEPLDRAAAQAELDDLLVFIGKTEARGACASHLMEQLRMESDALKAKLAPPVADRSVLSKQLGTLSPALSRAENERRQQGGSFDRELRAIKARLVMGVSMTFMGGQSMPIYGGRFFTKSMSLGLSLCTFIRPRPIEKSVKPRMRTIGCRNCQQSC